MVERNETVLVELEFDGDFFGFENGKSADAAPIVPDACSAGVSHVLPHPSGAISAGPATRTSLNPLRKAAIVLGDL
ncbi:MAG: hypothetical protein KF778_17580 [Rhodocyclaceae bacterium]|nr:hypothetical protein [Rhodocyclaceae bacterium]MBX3670215.1 hypothetical protein [Rhodocyclaceae bacterium]